MSFVNQIMEWLKAYLGVAVRGWNRFWFVEGDVRLLGIIRLLVGLMILYTHIVWTIDFEAFFLPDGAIPSGYGSLLNDESGFFWSHFNWFESNAVLWILHFVALIVFAMFAAGFCTRVVGILSFLFVVSYANRAFGALFGLDQINAFLTLYLAIGPSGKAFSIDSLIHRKRHSGSVVTTPGIMANVSIRLIQIHMCVVYLFAGLSKLQGESWWRGDAIWGAMASYEYQTVDMIWMANYLWLINLMTLASLVFEISYAFVIWHRWARPIYMTLAVALHLGIGLCMGMMTFGIIMIVGNMAFLSPRFLDEFLALFKRKNALHAAGQGG